MAVLDLYSAPLAEVRSCSTRSSQACVCEKDSCELVAFVTCECELVPPLLLSLVKVLSSSTRSSQARTCADVASELTTSVIHIDGKRSRPSKGYVVGLMLITTVFFRRRSQPLDSCCRRSNPLMCLLPLPSHDIDVVQDLRMELACFARCARARHVDVRTALSNWRL